MRRAGPCDARRTACPDQVLTDNGKVFTARFGPGPGPVLFDRVCQDNGIRHLLTAPYSPTTTGKVERFHRTLRDEWVRPNDRVFATIVEAQASLDAWVEHYNTERPHQSLGMAPPVERFRARPSPQRCRRPRRPARAGRAARRASRRSDPLGRPAGRITPRPVHLSGRARPSPGSASRSSATRGLVEILHAGVVVATHAQRHRPSATPPKAGAARRAREATAGITVTRIVDATGHVSFAGTSYRAGRSWARATVEVSIVGGSVQLAKDGKVIRVHPIRHDRIEGARRLRQPQGPAPPHRSAPDGFEVSDRSRSQRVVQVPGLDTCARSVTWPPCVRSRRLHGERCRPSCAIRAAVSAISSGSRRHASPQQDPAAVSPLTAGCRPGGRVRRAPATRVQGFA